jgi:hypothetical protein
VNVVIVQLIPPNFDQLGCGKSPLRRVRGANSDRGLLGMEADSVRNCPRIERRFVT